VVVNGRRLSRAGLRSTLEKVKIAAERRTRRQSRPAFMTIISEVLLPPNQRATATNGRIFVTASISLAFGLTTDPHSP
jgi:hypothetical protein